MDDKTIISLCSIALESVDEYVNSKEYTEIHKFINKYDEWGIGLEMLIDVLCENNRKIEIDQFNKIKEAMISMGLHKSDRMTLLIKQVKNT